MWLWKLRPPELLELPVEYKTPEGARQRLLLRLRVFSLSDIAWLTGKHGKEWYATLLENNDAKAAIEILAHQVDNRDAVEVLLQMPLEEGLKKHTPFTHTALAGMLDVLTDLWGKATEYARMELNEDTKKKTRQLLYRRIFWTPWWCACSVILMGVCGWLTFTQ